MRQSTLLFLTAVLIFWRCESSFSQDSLSDELAALDAELDAIFANESDSLSLMALVDSLISLDTDYSELQFRIGYSSRVTSAGRDFGIDQQGLAPGISYYHKSGLFADISGFWNSELDPKYNLSVATIGYLGRIKRKTTYSLTYDHSFYSENDPYNTLTNSVSGAVTHYFKHFYTGVDYSYSFGTETANRIIWNVTGSVKFKGFGPFSRVSILPSIALLFGNQNVINQYVNASRLDQFVNSDETLLIKRLNQSDLRDVTKNNIIQLHRNINSGSKLTRRQQAFLDSYYDGVTTEVESETFDLLNYYLTLPIVFYSKNFTAYVSYNYNIPRNLSNIITYEPNGYFGFSLTYNLRL